MWIGKKNNTDFVLCSCNRWAVFSRTFRPVVQSQIQFTDSYIYVSSRICESTIACGVLPFFIRWRWECKVEREKPNHILSKKAAKNDCLCFRVLWFMLLSPISGWYEFQIWYAQNRCFPFIRHIMLYAFVYLVFIHRLSVLQKQKKSLFHAKG